MIEIGFGKYGESVPKRAPEAATAAELRSAKLRDMSATWHDQACDPAVKIVCATSHKQEMATLLKWNFT